MAHGLSMQSGEVVLKSSWHQFRSISELKKESRGGYLEGQIFIPENVSTIRISLATHSAQPESHVNLPFVTPSVKTKHQPHCKELRPEDHEVVLNRTPDGFTCKPNYWPNALCLGAESFNNRILHLGKNGLQLTICKATQKGQSHIGVDKMLKHHRLSAFNGEFEKARLKVTFETLNGQNIVLFSKPIVDKNKYLLSISSIETQFICDRGDQIILIIFNKSVRITQDMNLKLTLFYDILTDEQTFSSYQSVSENVVKFKINAKGHGTHAEAFVVVTVEDEDIELPNFYDQIDEKFKIKIEEHFEHPKLKCVCKLMTNSTNFKETKVKQRRRPKPYNKQVKPSGASNENLTGDMRRVQRPPQKQNQAMLPPRQNPQPSTSNYAELQQFDVPEAAEPQVAYVSSIRAVEYPTNIELNSMVFQPEGNSPANYSGNVGFIRQLRGGGVVQSYSGASWADDSDEEDWSKDERYVPESLDYQPGPLRSSLKKPVKEAKSAPTKPKIVHKISSNHVSVNAMSVQLDSMNISDKGENQNSEVKSGDKPKKNKKRNGKQWWANKNKT